MDLQGKVVTGGGTGMGKAIAKLLAGQQRRRQLLPLRGRGHRDGQGARDHPPGTPIKADVSSAAAVAALVEQTERELGRLDVLVNNAGYTKFVPMKDPRHARAEWDRTLMSTSRASGLHPGSGPAMRRAGGGVVLNVTSAGRKWRQQHGLRRLQGRGHPSDQVPGVCPRARDPGQCRSAALVVTRWWGHASEEELNQMRASFRLAALH